jgi:DNA-binding MarR family transcriptional regulator
MIDHHSPTLEAIMQNLLIRFIDTLDSSLKKFQVNHSDAAGFGSLTIHQLQYLETIYSLGIPTISQIAEALGFSRASVTAGVNKLVSMGYVVKKRSQEDRRVVHVHLTENALPLIAAKQETLTMYEGFIRSALSEQEFAQFTTILEKLVDVFEHNAVFTKGQQP